MIAIDTNVLLRYLLEDDDLQFKKATKIINGKELILVTDVVLLETIWTLTGKKYKQTKNDIIKVIIALFEEPNICFESDHTIWKSLVDYREAKPVKINGKNKEAGFADSLIVNKSRFISIAKLEEFNGLYTFDVAALEIPGTRKP